MEKKKNLFGDASVWAPTLLEQFQSRSGFKIENHGKAWKILSNSFINRELYME